MPPSSANPLKDRKDVAAFAHLGQSPTDMDADMYQDPCLQGGQRGERGSATSETHIDGLMDILFRLYACYLSWYARSRGCEIDMPVCFNRVDIIAASSKARLFLTVPHEFRIAPHSVAPGSTSLEIKSVRVPGTTRTEHFVLYPGARREQCLRQDRPVPQFRWFGRLLVGATPYVRRGAKIPARVMLRVGALSAFMLCVHNLMNPREAETRYLDRAPP